jgi:hypothetical protein
MGKINNVVYIFLFIKYLFVSCSGRDKIKESPLYFFNGCRKRRLKDYALTPEIYCDQTAMGLPAVTFLIAK